MKSSAGGVRAQIGFGVQEEPSPLLDADPRLVGSCPDPPRLKSTYTMEVATTERMPIAKAVLG